MTQLRVLPRFLSSSLLHFLLTMKELEKPLSIVKNSVKDVIEEGSASLEKSDVNYDTRLLGSESGIDSLDLVNIIVVIEDKVEDEYGESITIANEEAMSRAKSPFINIESLAQYVNELLSENQPK